MYVNIYYIYHNKILNNIIKKKCHIILYILNIYNSKLKKYILYFLYIYFKRY